MGKGTHTQDDDFGILLGWDAAPAGERIALKMQSTRKVVEKAGDVREYRYFMTKAQAVQLGNYLFTIAGETAPVPRERGFFRKLMGG